MNPREEIQALIDAIETGKENTAAEVRAALEAFLNYMVVSAVKYKQDFTADATKQFVLPDNIRAENVFINGNSVFANNWVQLGNIVVITGALNVGQIVTITGDNYRAEIVNDFILKTTNGTPVKLIASDQKTLGLTDI